MAQYQSSTTVTTWMISKRAKHLKVQRPWEHRLCGPNNDFVYRSRKTLAERARCEHCVLSKTHISFKVYSQKWCVHKYWPSWNCVVTPPILSDSMYGVLREALKHPIVNCEPKIAHHVALVTLDIGSDTPKKGVADNEKLEGRHACISDGSW